MPSPKVLLTITTLTASAPALADLQPPQMTFCNSFEQKPDGAWSPTRSVTIHGPTGTSFDGAGDIVPPRFAVHGFRFRYTARAAMP